jgi:hypothetical protein
MEMVKEADVSPVVPHPTAHREKTRVRMSDSINVRGLERIEVQNRAVSHIPSISE